MPIQTTIRVASIQSTPLKTCFTPLYPRVYITLTQFDADPVVLVPLAKRKPKVSHKRLKTLISTFEQVKLALCSVDDDDTPRVGGLVEISAAEQTQPA